MKLERRFDAQRVVLIPENEEEIKLCKGIADGEYTITFGSHDNEAHMGQLLIENAFSKKEPNNVEEKAPEVQEEEETEDEANIDDR